MARKGIDAFVKADQPVDYGQKGVQTCARASPIRRRFWSIRAVVGSFRRLRRGNVSADRLLFSDADHIRPYFDRYARGWSKIGATVIPISPDPSGQLSPETLRLLQECTGVFMGGGDTRRYHEVYIK